jgi:hypothetical protein
MHSNPDISAFERHTSSNGLERRVENVGVYLLGRSHSQTLLQLPNMAHASPISSGTENTHGASSVRRDALVMPRVPAM